MVDLNPYRAPETASTLQRALEIPRQGPIPRRIKAAVWGLIFLYPVWLLGSFYATYLVAWMELGHAPRPMRDDPKYISSTVSAFVLISGVILMLMPLLAPIGLIASCLCPFGATRSRRRVYRVICAILYVILCVSAVFVLRTDPGRVVEWWFD